MIERTGVTILAYRGKTPRIHPTVFIAPGCRIIGDVEIGEGASIWFNCVLRGDVNFIRIGAGTNIQDGSVVHCDGDYDGSGGYPAIIGEHALLGHLALVHGARVGDGGFVGMGAMAMNGAVIESGAMLAAGALLTPHKVVPPGQLWAGRPARYLRDLAAEEQAANRANVAQYAARAQEYRR